MMLTAMAVEDDDLMSQGSRPWSEATFGGGTSFEVATSATQPPTEPPALPAPEPWPVVPRPSTPGTPGTPPSPMLAPEEELDDLQVGTGKRKKKRLRLKKRTPEATSPQSEAVEETKESQEQEPRPEIDLRSILQSQVAEIEAAKHRLEVACRDELDRLQHLLEHAADCLGQTLSLDHVVPVVPVVPESCALSADFSTLEETPDAKCFGSPAGAAWSPIQVVISPQSQGKDVVRSPEAAMASKHREWSQCFLRSGIYAVFAQLVTLLSMVVMWLDTEFAAMPLELETQPAWLIAVRVLNWICTACFTVELALRIKAASTCKEMWGSSRLWNLYDALIVSLAWADEIYILAMSSELQILRVARVLRVVRLFRFCQHLEGWAMALMDSLHALLWSVAVMALVLFSASICLTSNCADWVKDQIDSANPGWTDLLEKRDPVLLNDPKTAELVMNIWAWFGSLPRCSYTLLRCWGSCEAESQALLQVGFFAAAAFQLYFLTMVVVVLNVMVGLVVEAILDSSSRDDRRDISS